MIRLAIPEIGETEVDAVAGVLRTGFLVQGEHVRIFEERMADFVGARHAVAVSSGTAALHLALLALGVGPGDEVVVPGFTHPATANVVELVGARAILVDVDLRTFNIDPAAVVEAIGPRTKAIVPVHLFGQPAEMGSLLRLAADHGLSVIEDAACALGSAYRGQRCGTFGTVAAFSFHPRKVITTGEGGILTTNDDGMAAHLRRLRNHGQEIDRGRGRFLEAGLNYRLTDFQAALGTAQMARLPQILAVRAGLAEAYARALASIPGVTLPTVLEEGVHSWQSYVVLIGPPADRNDTQRRLGQEGIETTLGTYALAAQPHWSGHPDLPMSRVAQERSLALPLHSRMSTADVSAVARALREAVAT